MTAYAFGQLKLHNKDWMEEYTRRIAPLFKQYNAEVVAKGPATLLEGKGSLPDVAICIAFPNADAAQRWYDDPETQELVTLRQTGSEFELMLVGE